MHAPFCNAYAHLDTTHSEEEGGEHVVRESGQRRESLHAGLLFVGTLNHLHAAGETHKNKQTGRGRTEQDRQSCGMFLLHASASNSHARTHAHLNMCYQRLKELDDALATATQALDAAQFHIQAQVMCGRA